MQRLIDTGACAVYRVSTINIRSQRFSVMPRSHNMLWSTRQHTKNVTWCHSLEEMPQMCLLGSQTDCLGAPKTNPKILRKNCEKQIILLTAYDAENMLPKSVYRNIRKRQEIWIFQISQKCRLEQINLRLNGAFVSPSFVCQTTPWPLCQGHRATHCELKQNNVYQSEQNQLSKA